MSSSTDSSWEAPSSEQGHGTDDTPDVAVEMYEDDGRVVFFDSENPLAWLEASTTVRLTDLV